MEINSGNIYQAYNKEVFEAFYPHVSINLLEGLDLSKTNVVVKKKPFSIKLAGVLASIGIILLLIYFIPGLIELANSKLSGSEVNSLTKATENATGRALPIFNPALPKTNRLIVPSIGVDTDIEEATLNDYETALKKGVWRVSDFGQPDKIGAPVILAAHRYGYLAWTNSYRRFNSFYNLPKMKVGDTVEIIWLQRKYVYGVYKTENSTQISDYSADLILYTCESLNGDERIFVYAKEIS